MSAAFEDALATIWVRTLPVLRGRLDVIDDAVAARAGARPTAALDEAARAEAHKLAGLLGTFGRPDGTELARALEARLGGAGGDVAELRGLAADLRAVVQR